MTGSQRVAVALAVLIAHLRLRPVLRGRRRSARLAARRLEGRRGCEHAVVVGQRARELQPDRQRRAALRHAAGHRDRRQAREADRRGQDVAQVHRVRIVGARAQREGREGRGRAREQVELAEQREELVQDQPPHREGLVVPGVEIAGGQREGPSRMRRRTRAELPAARLQ
jgi:hypothetical protein